MAAWDTPNETVPYASQLVNAGVTAYWLTGNGTDATDVRAAATGKQIHIVGGAVSAEDAVNVAIISNTTTIFTLCFAAAGTLPLPPVWTVAGEKLAMKLSGAVTTHAWVETVALSEGQHCGLIG